MSTLRQMIDGQGSLQLGLTPINHKSHYRVHDDVLIRRKVNRSGPRTDEVIVGRILAMSKSTADVSIQKNGVNQRLTVNLNEVEPVTQSFKRQSMQFNPQIRRQA